MKPSNLILSAGLILTLAVAGCTTSKPPVTKFGDHGTRGGQSGPEPGGRIGGPGGEGALATTTGIPQGPGHPDWPENAEMFKSDTVYFAFDSSEVRPGEKSKVSAVADYLKANPANALKIAGHCDERGTEEYNRSLGERRALALREEFASLGVDATRVDTISFGKDRPAEPGHDESAWSRNRRGEFILLTPPGK